jgi:hypothetical protein
VSDPAPVTDPDDLDDDDGEDYDDDDFRPAPAVAFRRLDRVAPAAGLVYALLGFIGSSLLPVGDVDPEDSAQVIAAQLADDRGRVSAGILLTMFSLFFLLVFVAWLHRWLKDTEGERGWLSTLALIGGVLMVAMMAVVVLLSIAATVLETYGDDPVIARTLLIFQWQAVAIAFVPTAAFIGGISLVGLGSGVLPKSLTYSGLAIALGLLLPPIAFLPFLFSTLWIGMLAILLLQRARYYGD